MTATIHLPPISDDQVSQDLRWLTKELATTGKAEHYAGGLLGGEHGYGVEFENDVFMLHPFCWCERDDCPWCWGCECPDEAYEYTVAGTVVSCEEWLDAWDTPLRHQRQSRKLDHLLCDYCRGERESAPNFLHKPSGTRVAWYKYIGRGMEVDMKADWRTVLADCLRSIA